MRRIAQHYDVVIIGAGPAGLFAALTLSPQIQVLMIDRKERVGGAGGATDGKLNLSPHIGLDLAELRLTEEAAQGRIEAVDRVFPEHGADPALHGVDQAGIQWWLERVSWVRRQTPKGGWDISLVPVRQRHMGTDFAHRVTAAMAATIRRQGGPFGSGPRSWTCDWGRAGVFWSRPPRAASTWTFYWRSSGVKGLTAFSSPPRPTRTGRAPSAPTGVAGCGWRSAGASGS